MEQLFLAPISQVNGSVTLPGSKSLSNRILLLAALSNGTTVVENLLDSDDIRHMLGALKQLGVNVTLNTERTVATVEGVSGVFNTPTEPLFLGNAGTAYRAALMRPTYDEYHHCLISFLQPWCRKIMLLIIEFYLTSSLSPAMSHCH